MYFLKVSIELISENFLNYFKNTNALRLLFLNNSKNRCGRHVQFGSMFIPKTGRWSPLSSSEYRYQYRLKKNVFHIDILKIYLRIVAPFSHERCNPFGIWVPDIYLLHYSIFLLRLLRSLNPPLLPLRAFYSRWVYIWLWLNPSSSFSHDNDLLPLSRISWRWSVDHHHHTTTEVTPIK